MKTKIKTIFLYGLILIIINFFASINIVLADSQSEQIKKLEESEREAQRIVINRPSLDYKSNNLADPFRLKRKGVVEETTGAETTVLPLPSLIIQGIVWGGGKPQAIINNKILQIGDVIENAHIVDINKSGVDIIFNGQQHNLPAPAKK